MLNTLGANSASIKINSDTIIAHQCIPPLLSVGYNPIIIKTMEKTNPKLLSEPIPASICRLNSEII